MTLSSKDRKTLERMIHYCAEIEETLDFFGRKYEIFDENKIFRNAVVLCILQIGELVSHISDEFRAEYKEIKWQQVKGLRNIIAHRYGTISVEEIWNIVQVHIPKLDQYCREILETQ